MSFESRTVGIIAATNQEWVLGRTDGSIPWKHVGDQKMFKETTKGSNVIMGKLTWEGIPEKYRPLRDRTNIVISKTLANGPDIGVKVFRTIGEAMQNLIGLADHRPVWFIGGRGIYEEALQHCNTVHLTMVPDEVPSADDIVYMPDNVCSLRLHGEGREHPYNEKLRLCEYRLVEDKWTTDGN
jgi:dihydrofolate reductase